MRLAIIGSRTFNDYDLMRRVVTAEFQDVTAIASGGAKGTDSLARRLALELGVPIVEHLPDWARHGKPAGPIRNRTIVEDTDAVLASWDGESRGTKGAVNLAQKAGKIIRIVQTCTGSGLSAVQRFSRASIVQH